jgi:hypothetical protein
MSANLQGLNDLSIGPKGAMAALSIVVREIFAV